MPLAGTHIAVTAAVLAAVRKFLRIRFSDSILMLGAAFGLLPDLDIPAAIAINLAFGTSLYFHKIYTHAAIIPMLLFLAAIAMKYFGKGKTSVVMLVAAVAWFVHLLLDCHLATGSSPVWIPAMGPIGFCREVTRLDILVLLDALMILLFTLYIAYMSNQKNHQRQET